MLCRTYLFSVYMDDLSTVLSGYNVGCYVEHTCVIKIIYADDFVVLRPSGRGL